jgi:hypothetical protein
VADEALVEKERRLWAKLTGQSIVADEALVELTAPQFKNLMQTQGLDRTVQGVLSIANEELELGSPLTMESLANGTHPILDKLDRYKGIAPEQRNITPEEVLTIFTNVDDHGKYDPKKGEFSGLKAAGYSAARMVPETVGGGLGWKAGLAAATPVAAAIPPLGWLGYGAKGVVYGVGAMGGAILGAIAAGEAEDAIIGEKAPVVPSLQPAANFGETGMFAVSMLASPWKLVTSLPKAKTGALEFLENFKHVSKGKFTDVADEAFQLAAKNAGLSDNAAAKLFERASRARAIASERGPMFGGGLGVNLGITRFNPAGYAVDPRKGPLGIRALGAMEGGIDKSMKFARENPKRFFAAEGLVGVGAGTGAYVAQDLAPYDDSTRMGYEALGSLVIPIPAQLALDAGPNAVKGLFRTLRTWYGSVGDEAKDGILTSGLKKDSAKRILQALEKSEEYAVKKNAETGLDTPASEKLSAFIKALGEEAEIVRRGSGGEEIKPTVADLASAAGLDFSPTLRTIQNELAKSSADLAAATGRGREELQTGAIAAVRALAATGDPLALAYAARIQQGLYEQNIMDGIDSSVTKLMAAASKVVGRDVAGGSDRVDLSKKLYDVLTKQIDLGKVRERRLWNEVGSYPLTQFYAKNGREIQQPNVLQLLDRPSREGGLNFASKGAQDDLSSALSGYQKDIDDLRDYFQNGTGRNPATAQKFFEMRSALLARAATLRKTGAPEAGSLDQINDALLRDLTGQKDGAAAPYNAARAYTFARNNVYTRSFLSDLIATDKNRGLVLDPQNLLDRVFSGGNLSTAKRFGEIRAAGRFLVDKGGITEAEAQLMTADELMSAALRDSLGRVMDRQVKPNPVKQGETIETFVVNPRKLETFKQQPGTKELFALIGDLEVDLTDAQSAQKAFDNMLSDPSLTMNPATAKQAGMSDTQLDRLYATRAFQTVLEFEDPGKAVAKALSSERPTLALNRLYRMADETNYQGSEYTREQALQGFKSAIFNNALRKSNNTAGLPNGDSLQKSIFGQMDGVKPDTKFSMKDFMLSKGLATEPEMEEVQKAIKTLRGVEEAFATNNFENILFKNPSMAKLFYVRIAGATFGGAAQQQLKKFLNMPQMSGGLIAEQTGSDLVQRVLLRGPETQRLKVMTEMFSNPKLLASMMKDLDDKKQADAAMALFEKVFEPFARQTGRRIPLGLRPVIEEEYGPPEPENRPMNLPQNLPPNNQQGALNPPAQTPALSSGPVPSPIQQQPAAVQSALQGSGPVDRARYAAYFPEDRELMGIGSLIGGA